MHHSLAAKVSLLVTSVLLDLSMGAHDSDFTIEHCKTNSDCGPGYCCKIGMSRFAVPTCAKQGSLGDSCLMGAQPEDKLLFYPNGKVIEAFGIYRLFCPCEGGLTCHAASCKPSESKSLAQNQLYTVDDFDYRSLDSWKKNETFDEFDN